MMASGAAGPLPNRYRQRFLLHFQAIIRGFVLRTFFAPKGKPMAELGQHSLLQNCVELLRAIEKLPASPAQQELLDQAGDLMAALAEELRSHREGRQFLLKLIGRAPLPDEDHQLIRQLALAYGFTLREQSDGKKDLNGYVYAFGQALLEAAREQSRKQRRAAKTPGPGHLP